MPPASRLRIRTVFGPSLREILFLASHPAETHDQTGKPRPDARTLVLGLRANRAVFLEELPLPLSRSWYSSSGTAYCTSIQRATILVFKAGQWTEETFSPKPVDVVRYVYALPDTKAPGDVVFLATQKHLFVRQGGKWSSKRVPGEGFPQQMVGDSADDVFVGGPTLLRWDGKKLNELESPEDDSMRGLAISADDRLIGGNSYVSASTPDGGWERITTPVKGFFSFARFGDAVYAVSDDRGVLQVYPGPPAILSRPLDPLGLVAVGDGLIAYGNDTVLAFDGRSWLEVEVPMCEPWGRPL